ncbi:hypothetical protein FNV43_RR24184 [Rhamnella rubrinervis]|uniref:PPM-type phosphatase domain-containing protein n=1 Tax=Rhamnella rubrinervis TaxID=2594499 RepID=A0A8K0DL09_9ROSA|nr:hypothetical protein FNV43_RR24184 [Rhamnella rubrinervis]
MLLSFHESPKVSTPSHFSSSLIFVFLSFTAHTHLNIMTHPLPHSLTPSISVAMERQQPDFNSKPATTIFCVGDPPEKCRERRRRRIEMRRFRSSPRQYSPRLSSETPLSNFVFRRKRHFMEEQEEEEEEGEIMTETDLPTLVLPPPVAEKLPVRRSVGNPMPVFAAISTVENMDKRLSVKEDFCRPEIIGGHPLHLFSICDAPGGPHVSVLCKELMHLFIAEELTRLNPADDGVSRSSISFRSSQMLQMAQLRSAMKRSFERMDRVSQNLCLCGKRSIGHRCACIPVRLGSSGSAAVVAVFSADTIMVANFGHSRAVLCRAGKAISLSQVPKREAYGRGLYEILKMSSVKLKYGKSSCSSEVVVPEISITERVAEDECLIMASDGIWNVIPEDVACGVASRCLGDQTLGLGVPPPLPPRNNDYFYCCTGTSNTSCSTSGLISNLDDYRLQAAETNDHDDMKFPCKSGIAATILCRLALGRGSYDNVSVIVIDLKRN